jgi:hypothetical protein
LSRLVIGNEQSESVGAGAANQGGGDRRRENQVVQSKRHPQSSAAEMAATRASASERASPDGKT